MSHYNVRMQMVVVAAFVAVMSILGLGGVWVLGAGWLLGLAGLYVAIAWVLGRVIARRGIVRLLGGVGGAPAALGMLAQLYLLAGLIGLMLAGWGGWIESALHLQRVPLVGQWLALLPFVGALLAYWHALYPLDQAMRMRHRAELVLFDQVHLPSWTRSQYIAFNVRHNLLFVAVPASLLMLATDLMRLAEGVIPPAVASVTALVLAGGIFLVAPAMIVHIWQTAPLPPGPLRSRLAELCGAMRLRFRNILIWQTGGVITNAGVMGLVGPVRYVLLSDALLDNMPPEAVEAVFMHEAGHVVHRHIITMVVFTVGLATLLSTTGEIAGRVLHLPDEPTQYVTLAVMAAVWLWIFGRISRLLERQADVFAASHCQATAQEAPSLTAKRVEIFNQALLLVAKLNGIAPEARNFRHGSIRLRVNFLSDLLASGQGHQAIDRQVARLRALCWAILAFAGLLLGMDYFLYT